jgi:hypothetical protein
MTDIRPLHSFFRGEFDSEANSGFARLSRVPDTHVRHFLDYYRSLNAHDQDSLADAASLWATLSFAPDAQLEYREMLGAHPAWKSWRYEMAMGRERDPHYYYSVPLLRTCIAQAKTDRARLSASTVPKELEDYAVSIKSVKAPELRKRVRTAFEDLLGTRPSKVGGGDWDYSGTLNGSQVTIGIDYGFRHAQLRYEVAVTSFDSGLSFKRIGFEVALGAGYGHWNFIVEENVDDSIRLLSEFVQYVAELPKRLPENCFFDRTPKQPAGGNAE